MIGIIAYGCGNLRSVENALDVLGLEYRRVDTAADLLAMERLILPGVGHYGHAMNRLRAEGLEPAIREAADRGTPLLGICVGMQLMFEGSTEAQDAPGLGLLPGRFEKFDDTDQKVPHMGWSHLDLGDRPGTAYFVHSYFLPEWSSKRSAELLGIAQYGRPFVAAFRSGNLAGFQFHPEKSGTWGLGLLKEALAW